MHKMVDGLRVELTQEEELSIKAEWDLNDKKKKQEQLEQEKKINSDLDVLRKCGISDEGIKILKPELLS